MTLNDQELTRRLLEAKSTLGLCSEYMRRGDKKKLDDSLEALARIIGMAQLRRQEMK